MTAVPGDGGIARQAKPWQVDAELAYDQVIEHVWRCPTCWPARDQLWALESLCPAGRELVERYAAAEVQSGKEKRGEPDPDRRGRAHG